MAYAKIFTCTYVFNEILSTKGDNKLIPLAPRGAIESLVLMVDSINHNKWATPKDMTVVTPHGLNKLKKMPSVKLSFFILDTEIIGEVELV